MKISEVFREARKIIKSKRQIFICLAIEDIDAPLSDLNKAKKIINDRLAGHRTYSRWLYVHHPKFWNFPSFRPGRIQWLDSLTAEFEAKEAAEEAAQ